MLWAKKVLNHSVGFVLLIWSVVPAFAFSGEAVVAIVHRSSPLQKLTASQLKAVFLGESRFAVPGVMVEVNDRDRNSEIYREFYASIAAMSPKDVSIHWARKVFTGAAPPPPRISGDDSMAISVVTAKPEAITYIYEKNLTNAVKVVYSVPVN